MAWKVVVLAMTALAPVLCAGQFHHRDTYVVPGTPAAKDPAVKGDWSVPLHLPPNSRPPSDDGAPEVNSLIKWTRGDFELFSGRRHEILVTISEPSFLVASALLVGGSKTLNGGNETLEMSITKDGVPLAKGSPLSRPPSRVASTASALVQSVGTVKVTLVNRSHTPVKVSLVVGHLPANKMPRRP